MLGLTERHYQLMADLLSARGEGAFEIMISDGEYNLSVRGITELTHTESHGDGISTPHEWITSREVYSLSCICSDNFGNMQIMDIDAHLLKMYAG